MSVSLYHHLHHYRCHFSDNRDSTSEAIRSGESSRRYETMNGEKGKEREADKEIQLYTTTLNHVAR